MSAERNPGAIVRRFLDAAHVAEAFDGCWIRKKLDGRWIAIGTVEGRVITVTYLDDGRKHVVRAVRKATSYEEQIYLEKCRQIPSPRR